MDGRSDHGLNEPAGTASNDGEAVLRTGETISDAETMFRIGAHLHSADAASVGVFLSYSKHTDDNFDNIRKLGVSLRYHF